MIPVVQILCKSWDFIPTDVVRPLASSTVSDVAVMARRLGMTWKSFDPGSGSMRAEGNGHIISSTMVRSLGTILQYSFTSRENAGNCCYIPLREADKLGFGLVEFDHKLFGPSMPGDLDVGSYHGIASTLSLVTSGLLRYSNQPGPESVLYHISHAMKSDSDFIPGLNDLVPLCSAMLSNTPLTSMDRWINRIPAPNLYRKGVTASLEGFRVFERRLQELVNRRSGTASGQSKHILACMQRLREEFGSRWENEQEWEHWDLRMTENPEDEQYAKGIVMEYHSEMTTFLRDSNVVYRYLVGEHTQMAIDSWANAGMVLSHRLVSDQPSDFGLDASCSIELMQIMIGYFEGLPNMAEAVAQKCHYWRPDLGLTVEEVEDAWFTMMFRAFCWQRSHTMVSGVAPLPSEYWNSKMPVYIG